jgi:dephospho-CoA kinase|tara:strand:+ start:10514 stop:10987 length:474 start_codon:yes stop_codon:yes gene_type:complete
MSELENIHLFAIVGLTGAGKSTVTDYFTKKGIPKIDASDGVSATEIISQAEGIAGAGQHRAVIDGIDTWATYRTLKHEFPGHITTIAIEASRHHRHHRLTKRAEDPIPESEVDQLDYSDIEDNNEGGIIAIADKHIENNGSLDELHDQLDTLLAQNN